MDTLVNLKRLAESHHRSLQGELHVILDRAARMAPPARSGNSLNLVTVESGGGTTWRREEMYGTEGR